MRTTRNSNLPPTQSAQRTFLTTLALIVAAVPFAAAQAPSATTSSPLVATDLSPQLRDSPASLINSATDLSTSSSTPASVSSELPDAPQASTSPNSERFSARTKRISLLKWSVAPNEIAEPMSQRSKIVGGLKHSVTPLSAVGWIASAGWTQLTNGSPNYGTDKGAFGQRLGAAALRNISEGIFSNCLFAPLFHEDPRYHIMGRGNNVLKRTIYAATRAVITRTDDGRTTPNFALLAGNAAGAALTETYYPAKNTTASEVTRTFGTSLGGSAIGFVVTEFLGDALVYAHLKKKD